MSCDNPNCADPECVGTKRAKQNIQNHVDNGRWAIVGVSGENHTFAYTIGLHHKNLPELIMVGLNSTMAMHILNHCGYMMTNGNKFKHGTVITELANLPTTIITVHEELKRKRAVQAYNHYGHWDFDLMQLVMPDANGLFPWDEGYDPRMKEAQAMLGNPPLEKMI